MLSQGAPLQQAIFPDLPRNSQMVDKNGVITDDWSLFFQNLVTSLQNNYKPEGIVMPSQPQSNVNILTGIKSIYNILYNKDSNQFIGNIINSVSNAHFWVPFCMLSTGSGSPSGQLAGNSGQLYLDTVAKVLYACITAGNAVSAVWSSV